jgi:hypothetical protein
MNWHQMRLQEMAKVCVDDLKKSHWDLQLFMNFNFDMNSTLSLILNLFLNYDLKSNFVDIL